MMNRTTLASAFLTLTFLLSSAFADAMNELPPKISVRTGKRVEPNAFLKWSEADASPSSLLRGAQLKGSREFRDRYCREVLAKRFPGLSCEDGRWASIRPHDRPEDLVESWVNDLERDLDRLPTEGQVETTPWSDDYWKLRWGATSYRYAARGDFRTYEEAIAAYAQPSEWNGLLSTLEPVELAKKVIGWSPSEKYDLTVGDGAFRLTNAQKEEGRAHVGESGDVESWMGLCHGWAAAAIQVPAPKRPVEVVGTEGVPVRWYPHDIRAMATLAWANGDHQSNFIGGRCNAEDAETHPNGRLKQEECFDNNPATFHLVLGNQIGKAKASFVMDVAFDYQVWNQPVESYRITYFNPLDPDKTSRDWKKVRVPYDDAFKAQDRFQNPPTRGKSIDAIVGVKAEVVYVGEVQPRHFERAEEANLISVTYVYDLELKEEDGHFVVTGGEWHMNFHPDFLWVPKKGTVASSRYDREPIQFTGKAEPGEKITAVAAKASRSEGYPLCQVLSVLLNGSKEEGATYRCR